MVPKEPTVSKLAAAHTTKHITFTIPKKPEIIRNPGSAKSQNDIMGAYNNGLMTIYGTKKHRKYYL